MHWKFKDINTIWTDDFWYDMTDGGYIKPENILDDPEQIKAVKDAVNLLVNFQAEMEEEGILDYK